MLEFWKDTLSAIIMLASANDQTCVSLTSQLVANFGDEDYGIFAKNHWPRRGRVTILANGFSFFVLICYNDVCLFSSSPKDRLSISTEV